MTSHAASQSASKKLSIYHNSKSEMFHISEQTSKQRVLKVFSGFLVTKCQGIFHNQIVFSL